MKNQTKLFLVIIHFQCHKENIKKFNFDKPLEIKAFQYDIVCNGVELSSGAIRNHIPELMYKLISVAGYSEKDVNEKFSGMINALKLWRTTSWRNSPRNR